MEIYAHVVLSGKKIKMEMVQPVSLSMHRFKHRDD